MPDASIFVVGVPRSGTTLLSAMLSTHSRLDCGPESRFFARYRFVSPGDQARILDPVTWPRPAVDFIASLHNQGHPITELYGLELAEIGTFLAEREPSLAAMLESLTVLHARKAGKARWMEKTPRHLLMTDTLRELWPEARIVRIVRDPRDVALSLSRMPFGKESVVGNLARIDQDDRASRERILADPLAMTLRYEDLVTEPERQLRLVCEFIGEVFEPVMLDSSGSAAGVAASHEWWKESVSGPLHNGSVGRWRDEMSADVRRFAALHLAGYLREHGYEGARDARAQLAVLPVADEVGPGNEGLLLDLARRDMTVIRPAPSTPLTQHAQEHLVFLGVKGQLDPTRGQSIARRVIGLGLLGVGLAVRRLRGRPVLWVRQATLRARSNADPDERLMAAMLRPFARSVPLDEVPRLVDDAKVDAKVGG